MRGSLEAIILGAQLRDPETMPAASERILAAYEIHNGSIYRAAAELGVGRRTYMRWMRFIRRNYVESK